MVDFVDSLGIEHTIIVDQMTGAIALKYVDPDVDVILDANKRYSLEHGRGMSKSGDLKHVARIPPIVYYKWLAEGIDALNPNHGGAVRRKLNSSEYAYLRTGTGRVGKGAYD